MIKSIFQSIGVVFALVFMVVLTIATMYLSYILGIAVILISLFVVVTYLIRMLNSGD